MFRIYLPSIYLLIVIALFLGHAQGAGHGRSLELMYVVSFPSLQILEFLFGRISSLQGALFSVLLGLIQYFLLGYFIDTLRKRNRRE